MKVPEQEDSFVHSRAFTDVRTKAESGLGIEYWEGK